MRRKLKTARSAGVNSGVILMGGVSANDVEEIERKKENESNAD
jgi:hypothetical protein